MKKLYLIIIILISVIICIPTITKASMIDDVISGADTFLNTEPEKDKNNLGGGTSKVDEQQLKEVSTGLYNILFYIGIAITVLVGAVMGIQFMMASAEGKAKIDGLMDALRNEIPKEVSPFKVTALEDYKKSVRTDIATGETSALTLPESNVLYFELEDGAWFCVRPSGTEPKIKYYAGVKGTDAQDAADKLEALSKAVVEL